MHHGPTELDDTLRAFEELSVLIVDMTDYFVAEGFQKCIHFIIYLYVFKLMCTRWENFCICDRQIHNCHLQLLKYSTVIP
jgi:hypothetical protein